MTFTPPKYDDANLIGTSTDNIMNSINKPSKSANNDTRQIEHDSIEYTIIVQGLLPSNECIPNSNCVRTVDAYDRPEGSIRDMLYEKLDSVEVYDDNILYGYWFKPHEACAVNIIFNKDNSFVMRDYNPDDEQSIVYERVGTFKVKGDSIHLSSKDGRKIFGIIW